MLLAKSYRPPHASTLISVWLLTTSIKGKNDKTDTTPLRQYKFNLIDTVGVDEYIFCLVSPLAKCERIPQKE